MAILITNFEAIPASKAEIKAYYEIATEKINALFVKYTIRNPKGKFEEVSADQLKALLSFAGFFQPTPLKSIFFDQKQPFVPQEIIDAFRGIISDAPANMKVIFFNTFITFLTKKGWDKLLSVYFEKQYNVPSDGVIILDEFKDFSFGSGIYRITFQLRIPHREKVIVFLKGSSAIQIRNELLYFHFQKLFLVTASYAKMPYILSNNENEEELLLSPLVLGIASDTILSKFTQFYRETKQENRKSILKKALEILIEAFIRHAALGDILRRNDRHLLNSLIAFVINGVPQMTMPEDLNNSEKILGYANAIAMKETAAFSLINVDLEWLLGGKNAGWIFVDIDCGLSELNLLSLLPEFNDYNLRMNSLYEKRKEYVERYFNVYCQTQEAILKKKRILFSEIKKVYSPEIAAEKLKILTQAIKSFEESKQPVIELFKRYLLNFRTRRVYKATLVALYEIAKKSNDVNLLDALKKAELLKYLPLQSDFFPLEPNVFLQLQCFRGVLSKKDRMMLAEEGRTTWERIATRISIIAEKFNRQLFETLQNKKQFIKNDTAELLSYILSNQTDRKKRGLSTTHIKLRIS